MGEGVQLVHLLDPARGAAAAMAELQPDSRSPDSVAIAQGGEAYGEALSLYLMSLQARTSGEAVRELELLCTCLKTWAQLYMDAEGTGLWMTPLLIFLCNVARRAATVLDSTKRSEANSDAYLK